VLKDPSAPAAIIEWANSRVELGLNNRKDPKIAEAVFAAEQMHKYRESLEK
jgi:hypothetical protein